MNFKKNKQRLFQSMYLQECMYRSKVSKIQGVSEVQFCTTERPQFLEFEVATCRTLFSYKPVLHLHI